MHNKPIEEAPWDDGERLFYRSWRGEPRRSVLVVAPAAERPAPDTLEHLAHEYALRDELDPTWAATPVELVREHGRTLLVLQAPDGEPLHRLVGTPMDIETFLRMSVGLSTTVGRLHARGLIHKDIKPTHVLVDVITGRAWLTGFGIASRTLREQQSADPPALIPGTLPYMAPEQTGRMSRSIDSRSDLYSMGVTLYQLATGDLPFMASEPMGWVHCHIARKPRPPHERSQSIPKAVSAIILKLLAKTPEQRYQTATGVEHDLTRCMTEWSTSRHIEEFTLGEFDIPDRLWIPEHLYGRTRETDIILSALDRVAATGKPELVLVTGYSGIGKSSVVTGLNEAFVARHSRFASGKFDQYKRDVPYATLAQAFQGLIRSLLAGDQSELQQCQKALREAVSPNGSLLLQLVPELRLILGEQPPAPELPSHDAQRRFHLLLQRFMAVFARPHQPLVLFLDDLQWLDTATLELLENLVSQPDLRHLLLIGAFRDNEVSPMHPLMRTLEVIRRCAVPVNDIVLCPLALDDLQQLLADCLHCDPARAAPLARLVRDKTGGNPFFALQFLTALAEEGLLTLDRRQSRWVWDPERIHAKGYTDNVVDLMVAKMNRIPRKTRTALERLACIGDSAEISLAREVLGTSVYDLHQQLSAAVRSGLVIRNKNSYTFLHDRLREAAYSSLPDTSRVQIHLQIGKTLAAESAPDQREERIFEIVNQLNHAAELLRTEQELDWLAELNLRAARRAKNSTAYASALKYLAVACASLNHCGWERNYQLWFSSEYLSAECELFTAQMEAAERRLSLLAERARSAHDVALVTRLRLTLYTALDRSDRSVEICLEYLRRNGTDWPSHPTNDEVRAEYDQIGQLLGSRQIEELLDLPRMTDPDTLDTLEVLTEIVTPAVFFDQNLCSIVTCRMVNLSLQHGNSDGSCFAYVWFGIIAGPLFGRYEEGFRFGQLGYELVEKRGLVRHQARTYMSFGNLVIPWVKHLLQGRDLVRRAFDAAHRVGDFTFAAYSLEQLLTSMLAAGDPLTEVQQEAEKALEFAKNTRFGLAIDLIVSQLQLVRTLRGLTSTFGCFNDDDFLEADFERHVASSPALADVEFGYWALKTQAHFMAADYAAAVDASFKAQPLFWAAPSVLEPSAFRFYAALAHAAFWDLAPAAEKAKHFQALLALHGHIKLCAEHCPANFENRAALVAAEIARIEGRVPDAEILYEQAIRSARENGFLHNEAVAHEVAGRFFLSRGLETSAYAHLRNALSGYMSWRARGKVAQLRACYPRLALSEANLALTVRLPSFQQLDLATVVDASQAVSGEIVLPKLIERLMTITSQNAGADRGVLLLPRGDRYLVEAEALISGDEVVLRQGAAMNTSVPETVVRYVIRTQEKVILDDVTKRNQFSTDEYLSGTAPRSILCLPLLRQAALAGLLYIENSLTSHAFTPGQTTVLEVLASQAAISLENTRLYADLQLREAKVRRLVDANIVGILIWGLEGQILEANDAFLRIVGYKRDDVLSGRINWRELTAPEWRQVDEEHIPELLATGTVAPYEKEYVHQKGHRVPVLITGAIFEGTPTQGVAFVVDLTDRKKAESDARESERRYREVELALAHANRVATMGQLSTSIAHEINQPIAAAVNNAQAALRWLRAEPMNVEEARQAISRILENGNRAGAVIARIRALIRKTLPRKDSVDINSAIGEILILVQGEVAKESIRVETRFSGSLPTVFGDRVQLQQVVLNLLMNSIEAMRAVSSGSRVLQIGTLPVGADVLVTVQDSGPGLAEGTERIFEPFYTTKPGGFGIGLSICSSIIQAHGGRLWAQAGEPPGALFQFTLPARHDVREPQLPAQT